MDRIPRLSQSQNPNFRVHFSIVCGCVNVVSGEFVRHETDLSVCGLAHSRAYDRNFKVTVHGLGLGATP